MNVKKQNKDTVVLRRPKLNLAKGSAPSSSRSPIMAQFDGSIPPTLSKIPPRITPSITGLSRTHDLQEILALKAKLPRRMEELTSTSHTAILKIELEKVQHERDLAFQELNLTDQ
ncbi:hypothetical protein HAX54_004880 [Datura stramonium]|uniref:Uncharacterized protein n=1 Tax=Datura stramonium TaxID=4076 RepID=A0ABS8RUF9_DATST|nr:hypothetical protein [Datura stramonium]